MCDLICQKKSLWWISRGGRIVPQPLPWVQKCFQTPVCSQLCSQHGFGLRWEEATPSPLCSSLLCLGWENWQQKFSLGLWRCKLPLFLKWRGKLSMSSFPPVIWNVSEGHQPLNTFWHLSALSWAFWGLSDLNWQMWWAVTSLCTKALLAALTWTWKRILSVWLWHVGCRWRKMWSAPKENAPIWNQDTLKHSTSVHARVKCSVQGQHFS